MSKRKREPRPKAAEIRLWRKLEAACRETFLRGPLVSPFVVDLLHELSQARGEERERGRFER